MFRSVVEHESFPGVLPVQQGNSRGNNNRPKKRNPRMVSGQTFFISSPSPLRIFITRTTFRYEDTRQQTMCYDKEPDQDADKVLQDFTNLVTALLVDLEQGLTYYNSLFER